MTKTPLDHSHRTGAARLRHFARFDRVKAGDGRHSNVRLLLRRRKGQKDTSLVRQFLRIARGQVS